MCLCAVWQVAKERMLAFQQGQLVLPEARPLRGTDAATLARDLPALLALFEARDAHLLRLLSQRMREQAHGREETFDVWMKHESDLIQASSLAYGEMVRASDPSGSHAVGCRIESRSRALRSLLRRCRCGRWCRRRDAWGVRWCH